MIAVLVIMAMTLMLFAVMSHLADDFTGLGIALGLWAFAWAVIGVIELAERTLS